jgi:hypothetical protein
MDFTNGRLLDLDHGLSQPQSRVEERADNGRAVKKAPIDRFRNRDIGYLPK